MILGLIIAQSEKIIILSPDPEAPLVRLPPFLLYLLHAVFLSLPPEGLRSFGVGVPGVAFYCEIIQPYPLLILGVFKTWTNVP